MQKQLWESNEVKEINGMSSLLHSRVNYSSLRNTHTHTVHSACSEACNLQRASISTYPITTVHHKPHNLLLHIKATIRTQQQQQDGQTPQIPVYSVLLLATWHVWHWLNNQDRVCFRGKEQSGVKMTPSNIHIISAGAWGVRVYTTSLLASFPHAAIWCRIWKWSSM